jgi:hypothetical protein
MTSTRINFNFILSTLKIKEEGEEMRKKLIAGLIAVMLVVGLGGIASATVLDFEGLNGNLPSTYGLVNWESGSWFVYDSEQPPYNPHSGTGRTYESSGDLTPSWNFTQKVVFNGAYFSGYNYGTVQMDLYLNDTIVHSTGTFAPSDVSTFFATGYDGLVDKVVINTPEPDYWVMDDLTYNANTVPIPAAVWLFGSGLLGLFGVRRKFTK